MYFNSVADFAPLPLSAATRRVTQSYFASAYHVFLPINKFDKKQGANALSTVLLKALGAISLWPLSYNVAILLPIFCYNETILRSRLALAYRGKAFILSLPIRAALNAQWRLTDGRTQESATIRSAYDLVFRQV